MTRFCVPQVSLFTIALTLGCLISGDLFADDPASDHPGADFDEAFAKKVFTSPDGSASEETDKEANEGSIGQLPYRLMAPKKIEAGKRYPLVLFLHGSGERGNDNASQLVHAAKDFVRLRDQYPAFVIFPQCPLEKRWVETSWEDESGAGTFPDQPSAAMTMALAIVDEVAREHPVDSDRMYVCGLSMGGFGSWYAAATAPNRFAAAVAVCGGGDPQWADRYAGIPIWAHHGEADSTVSVHRSREMIAALANHGGVPEIRYTEYPGVGHDSWTQTFANDDVFAWLFSKRFIGR